jgi:DNA modification methylase
MREEIIGDCRLILGDCQEVLPTLGPVDAVVTDPPYGVDFAEWDGQFPGAEFWQPVSNCVADGGNVVVIPGEIDIPAKLRVLSVIFEYQWVIPWYKPNAMQFGKTGYTKQSLVWWLAKGKPKHKPSMIDVIVVPMGLDEDKKIGHPSPKPVRLMLALVGNFAAEGQTVLDPFMGSGTTGVACALTGRAFIGIEREPSYFDIACRRIEEAYRQPRLFAEPVAKPVQETLAL